MTNAQHENARMLAAAIDVSTDRAVALLDAPVLITADPEQWRLADTLDQLLSRTLSSVSREAALAPAVEIILGDASRRTRAPSIWVQMEVQGFRITEHQDSYPSRVAHPLVELLAACYIAAAATHRAAGIGSSIALRLPIVFDLRELLGPDVQCLYEPVDLGVSFLAGAGAIGNAVLLGFAALDVRGELHIADSDTISDGNLNRCVWFTEEHIGLHKAEVLAELAQRRLPNLLLVPHVCRLQQVPAAAEGGPWLERLIVAVDSRRARRKLQTELPHQVFDASTTGILEVVLHFNELPSSHACLSCIYYEAPDETAHEAHVADSLGVDLDAVRGNFVSHESAAKIVQKYPQLDSAHLVGLAYDSLFKQLCGEGALRTAADKQVLAPFGFVSVLAGALLAVEVARRLRTRSVEHPFNYWRVAPWSSPVPQLKQTRGRAQECEFCNNPVLQTVARKLWSGDG